MRRALIGAAAAVLAAVLLPPSEAADDWSDPDYLAHDVDNLLRSTVEGTQLEQLLDPAYHEALTPVAAETWVENLAEQLADLPEGRLHLTLGQLLPGGAVGDPFAYHDAPVPPTEANFTTRTGAELQGYLFWDGQPGPHPGIVITTGSIQAPQQSYWWAARTLARAGYLVYTFDVQGQGDSEAFGHDPGSTSPQMPTLDGFPFQQEANFVDGTLDALDWFLSDGNPLAAFLDRARLGLAGHSLGARAVSVVQQCSDTAEAWRELPVCGGRSYPIRAIVAWDGLSGTVTPVVPAMDQTADGYFLAPQPSYAAPDPRENLRAFDAWHAAGVDSYAFTVRGGTHLEWFQVPYLLPATTYGVRQADHYTFTWFERYVQGDPARAAAASAALVQSPIPDGLTGGATEYAWRANFFSARRLGAFSFRGSDGATHEATDLRAYAGLSPVGDWAGANRDQATERRE